MNYVNIAGKGWKIDLSGRSLGSSGSLDVINTVDIAIASMPAGYKLNELNLSNNRLLPSASASIAHIFKRYPNIRVLNLSDNLIGDAGAAAFTHELTAVARSLRVLHGEAVPLNTLDLSNNNIGEVGLRDLVASFLGKGGVNFPHLRHISLARNPLGADGALLLAQAVLDATDRGTTSSVKSPSAKSPSLSLRSLDLRQCGIEGVVADQVRSVFDNVRRAGVDLHVLGLENPLSPATGLDMEAMRTALESIPEADDTVATARSAATSVGEKDAPTSAVVPAAGELMGSPADGQPSVVDLFQKYVASQVEAAVAERTSTLESLVRSMQAELVTLQHKEPHQPSRSTAVPPRAVHAHALAPPAPLSSPGQSSLTKSTPVRGKLVRPRAALTPETMKNGKPHAVDARKQPAGVMSNAAPKASLAQTVYRSPKKTAATQQGRSTSMPKPRTLSSAPSAAGASDIWAHSLRGSAAGEDYKAGAPAPRRRAPSLERADGARPTHGVQPAATPVPVTADGKLLTAASASDLWATSLRFSSEHTKKEKRQSIEQPTQQSEHTKPSPPRARSPSSIRMHDGQNNKNILVDPSGLFAAASSSDLWAQQLRSSGPTQKKVSPSPSSRNVHHAEVSNSELGNGRTVSPKLRTLTGRRFKEEGDEQVLVIDSDNLDEQADLLLGTHAAPWLPAKVVRSEERAPRRARLSTTSYADQAGASADLAPINEVHVLSTGKDVRSISPKAPFVAGRATSPTLSPAPLSNDQYLQKQHLTLADVGDTGSVRSHRSGRSPSPSLFNTRSSSPRRAAAIAAAAAKGIPPALVAHAIMNPISIGGIRVTEISSVGPDRRVRRSSITKTAAELWAASPSSKPVQASEPNLAADVAAKLYHHRTRSRSPRAAPLPAPLLAKSGLHGADLKQSNDASFPQSITRGGSFSGRALAAWGASLRSSSPPRMPTVEEQAYAETSNVQLSPVKKLTIQQSKQGKTIMTSAEKIVALAKAIDDMAFGSNGAEIKVTSIRGGGAKKAPAEVKEPSSPKMPHGGFAVDVQRPIPVSLKAVGGAADVAQDAPSPPKDGRKTAEATPMSPSSRTSPSPSRKPATAMQAAQNGEVIHWKELAIRQIASTSLSTPKGIDEAAGFL